MPHFVEHLFVLPRVIGDAVQAAIDAHDGPECQDEFDSLSVWIDDSTARDAKAQTRDLLKPILASPGLALVPPPRGRLEHPIFTKHIRDGGPADILSLVGDRITFVSSHDEPLCQLADIAAWTVRRYAERRSDENAKHLCFAPASTGSRAAAVSGSCRCAESRSLWRGTRASRRFWLLVS